MQILLVKFVHAEKKVPKKIEKAGGLAAPNTSWSQLRRCKYGLETSEKFII